MLFEHMPCFFGGLEFILFAASLQWCVYLAFFIEGEGHFGYTQCTGKINRLGFYVLSSILITVKPPK